MSKDEPSGEVPAKIDASGGQGQQAGDHNVQYNQFLAAPRSSRQLDAATLGALNPHTAVGQVRRMRHDDAVVLLASAPPQDVTDVLKVMLEVDAAMTVSLLADINPRKAAELIVPLSADAPWLASLPTAARAIARHAVHVEWDQEWEGGLERAAQSASGTEGYFRKNANGLICWSEPGGACAIGSAVAKYYVTLGGTSGALGFPLSAEAPAVSLLGTNGAVQAFERGFIYSSRHGIYHVPGSIYTRYNSEDGTDGWLGFPTASAERIPGGSKQRFEGGAIYSSTAGTFAARLAVDEATSGMIPLSEEADTRDSPYGTAGRVQQFRASSGDTENVYSYAEQVIYRVAGGMRAFHDRLGGTGGWLGFPTSELFPHGEWGLGQSFEGGDIYESREPVAVPAATMQMIIRDSMYTIGPPESEERPLSDDDNDRIQFFKNGVVTIRGGKRQIWVAPGVAGLKAGKPAPPSDEKAGRKPKDLADPEYGFSPGSQFAGYRLEKLLGTGRIATVYRAYHEDMGREVALKVLAPALADDQAFRQRFVRESRLVARMEHPHIIPVYGTGEERGVPYIAMRLVRGGDLSAMVSQDRPMPAARVVAFLSPVASALDTAHEAGLVHRNVTPASMLVDVGLGRPEHVYLSDFGLARDTRGLTAGDLTHPGQFMGIPEYAAPEQITGGELDGRADQYALGCVAYTLLTGSVAYPRDQDIAVMYAQLYDPPPLVTAIRKDLPSTVNQVVARAMEKQPGDRYKSCNAFADALRIALGLPQHTSAGG
jgi:serine/threonine-protein kinase